MIDDSRRVVSVLVLSYIVGIEVELKLEFELKFETGQSGTQLLQRRLGNEFVRLPRDYHHTLRQQSSCRSLRICFLNA